MNPYAARLRLTFASAGPFRYTGHLDLMRTWERVLRRARVPIAYSKGFNPRPKLQLASPLPLGHAASAELLDIWLEDEMAPDEVAHRLVPVLPDGIQLREVEVVDLHERALQARMVGTRYHVEVDLEGVSCEEFRTRVEQLLARETAMHERRGKEYNLRALIEALAVGRCEEGEADLEMQLSHRPGATGRPEAVLDVLGLGDRFARYRREELLVEGMM